MVPVLAAAGGAQLPCPAGAVPPGAAAPAPALLSALPPTPGDTCVPWVPQATLARRARLGLRAWFQQESVSLDLTVQLEGI